MFEPNTIQWIQFFIRLTAILAIVPACYEAWKVAWLLKNHRFSNLLKNIAWGLLFFITARLLGVYVDNYFQSQIQWSGYVVTVSFWGWVAYYFHKQRVKIQRQDAEGRQRISDSLDVILDEMKAAKRELDVMSTN